jgi:hypothetical protein
LVYPSTIKTMQTKKNLTFILQNYVIITEALSF